jgi:putative tricarboxylic transport membrane protein
MMEADRLSGALLFALGLYIGYEALKLPFGGIHQPDSGFFPSLIALLLLCSSGLTLLATRRNEHVKETLRFGTFRVWIAVVALILYVVVLNRLGYLVSTFLMMVLLLRGLERLNWRTTLGVAFPAVVSSYIVFRWLGVPLPPGIIPL